MRTRRKQEIIDGVPHKHCTQCDVLKPIDEYYADKRYLDGKTSACKECRIRKALPAHYAWRELNPEKVKQHSRKARRQKLQQKYGYTVIELMDVLEAQNGECKICGRALSYSATSKIDVPHVDHDHKTGAVRGLLCSICNTGLGMFNDSLELLAKAQDYLMMPVQRERLSELAPEKGDATVRSHGNENHEKSAEMTDSPTIH